MDKIYLIIRKDFDNLENRDTDRYDILGYAETMEHATAIVKSLAISEAKYKGWDFSLTKKEYPQFFVKPIEKY